MEQKTQEWFQIRKGKITGTGLKKIIGTKKVRDTFFYEVIADRLSVDDGVEESAMDRGVRLESEAVEQFEIFTGKIVDRIGFAESDENEFMGFSPDGLIDNNGVYNEAVEVKCLSSANYVKAWIENSVPEDYYPQVIQAFIVNENLETLYFILYDPRVTVHPLHIIPITRKELGQYVQDYKTEEEKFINEVNQKIGELIEI